MTSQTHGCKPVCHDDEVAFRDVARGCFSLFKSFTQQMPTEVLPLTRLEIKGWDPEMKMCQPGPGRCSWARGDVLGDNQV